MRIGFDIGGVISRYPNQMRWLIADLVLTKNEVYLVTDMNPADALLAAKENGLIGCGIKPERIISCDWSKHGDLCKAVKLRELCIEIMFDDRPDYIAEGVPIGFCLMPRPSTPYYHSTWKNTGTPAVCVPPEEYEAFKKWKEQ